MATLEFIKEKEEYSNLKQRCYNKLCHFMEQNNLEYLEFKNSENYQNDAITAYVYDEIDGISEKVIEGIRIKTDEDGSKLLYIIATSYPARKMDSIEFVQKFGGKDEYLLFGGQVLEYTIFNIMELLFEYQF